MRESERENPRRRGSQVGEAVVRYIADPRPTEQDVHWTARLSAKNQITLPVALTRMLGMRAGDELNVVVLSDGSINMEKKLPPQKHTERLYGSLKGLIPEWDTPEKIDAWLENERNSWDR